MTIPCTPLTRPYAVLNAAGDCVIALATAYPLFAHILKRQVPAHARRYDSETRQWIIQPAYTPKALTVLRYVLPDAAILTRVDPA